MHYCNYNIPNDCSHKLNVINVVISNVEKDKFDHKLLKNKHFQQYKEPMSESKSEILKDLKKMKEYYRLKWKHYQEYINKQPLQANHLKNINRFINPESKEKYIFNLSLSKTQLLDPVWGFIWSINGVFNYYKFGIDPLNKILKSLFVKESNSDILIPTKFINIKSKDIGVFLGCLYDMLYKLPEHSNILKLYDCLNKKKIENYIYGIISQHSKFLKDNFRIHICDLKQNCDKHKKDLSNDCKMIPKYKLLERCKSRKQKGIMKYFEIQNKSKFEQFTSYFVQLYLDDKKEEITYFFHIFLTYLIFTCKDKNGIWDYYEGLNIFIDFDMNNKEQFILDIYNKKYESKTALDYIYRLYLRDKLQSVSIQVYNHNSTLYNKKFPDCGATMLRNFFKLILYNHEQDIFDNNLLVDLKANDNLIEYFKIFDKDIYFRDIATIESTGKKTKYFEKKDTIETAWNKVIQNIKEYDINYRNDDIEIDGKKIYYNIASGLNKTGTLPNLISVLHGLFEKNEDIKSQDNFTDIFDIILNEYEIDENVSDDAYGYIDFQNQYFKFTMRLEDGHYFIDDYKVLNSDRVSIKSEEMKYIYQYFDKMVPSNITNQNIWLSKLNINLLPQYLDNLDKPIYSSLFKYIISMKNTDLLKRLEIDLSKLDDISILYKDYEKLNWTKLNIKKLHKKISDLSVIKYINTFTILCNFDTNNLKLPKKIRKCIVKNMTTINKKTILNLSMTSINDLSFHYSPKFNQPLILPKDLKILKLGDDFNNGDEKKFDISYAKNLRDLVFDKHSKFNRTLFIPKSLINLKINQDFNNGDEKKFDISETLLENLIFDENCEFNKPIYLPKTIRNIEFGKCFNNGNEKELDMTKLIKLEKLEFSNKNIIFNKSIYLPNTIKILSLPPNFNNGDTKIFDIYNTQIKYLKLNPEFKKEIKLPYDIEKIYIDSEFFQNGNNKIFNIFNAKTIIFTYKCKFNKKLRFSKHIESIEFGKFFNNGNDHKLDFTDTTLNNLSFPVDSEFDQELILSKNLSKISIGNKFNNGDSKIFDISQTQIKILDFEPIKTMIDDDKKDTSSGNFISSSLLHDFDIYEMHNSIKESIFNKEIKLPNTCEILKLGKNFNNGDGKLLDLSHTKIKELKFSDSHIFNKEIKLPKNIYRFESSGQFNNNGEILDVTHCSLLKFLILTNKFNQPIKLNKELGQLILSSNYSHDIDLSNLSDLHSLIFSEKKKRESKKSVKIILPKEEHSDLKNILFNGKSYTIEKKHQDTGYIILH